MASLYKKRDIWYISLSIKKSRITRSLRTKDYIVAKELKPYVESQIINELTTGVKLCKDLSFTELVDRFLKTKHNWAESTYQLNRYILTSHLEGTTLPENPTSRAIHIRHINQCHRRKTYWETQLQRCLANSECVTVVTARDKSDVAD